MRAEGSDVPQLATVIAHLDEVCGLTWKTLILVYQLSVGLGAVGGMKARAKVVLCIINLALQEGVLITILFLSKDDLGEELVNLGPCGVKPSVEADVEGRPSDGAFKELDKDSVSSEGVLTTDRVELVLACL